MCRPHLSQLVLVILLASSILSFASTPELTSSVSKTLSTAASTLNLTAYHPFSTPYIDLQQRLLTWLHTILCDPFNYFQKLLLPSNIGYHWSKFISPAYASANYGITSVGGTSPTTNFGTQVNKGTNEGKDYLVCNAYSLPVAATITTMSFYSAISSDVKVGVYSDSGSAPSALLIGPVTLTGSSVGWNIATMTATYEASGTYWLCGQMKVTGGITETGTTGTLKYLSLSYDTAWPNPFGAPSTTTETESIYASYIMNEGYTFCTRNQYTDSTSSAGAVSMFSFYTVVGAAADHFIFAFYSDTLSGPSTITAIGSSQNTSGTNQNNFINGEGIVATATGVLDSVGINLAVGAGSVTVGIYSTFSSSTFSGLLGQGSVSAAAGWNDPTISGGIAITAGQTYYVVWETNNATVTFRYQTTAASIYYVAYPYAALPDPTGTLTTQASISMYMRMTYHSPAPANRLWYSALATPWTGSANTTWNTITYANGTTDNGWAGALTQNSYYWFCWQWDSTAAGPAYLSGSSPTGIYKAQTFGTLDSVWTAGTTSAQNWSGYLTYFFNVYYTFTLTESHSMGIGLSRTANFQETVTQPMSIAVNPSRTIGEVRTITQPMTMGPTVNRTENEARTITQPMTLSYPPNEPFRAWLNAEWMQEGYNVYNSVMYTKPSSSIMQVGFIPSSQGDIVVGVGVWQTFPAGYLNGKTVQVMWGPFVGHYAGSFLKAQICNGAADWSCDTGYGHDVPLQVLFSYSTGTQSAVADTSKATGSSVTLVIWCVMNMYDYTQQYYFDIDSIRILDSSTGATLFYNEMADTPVILGQYQDLNYGYIGDDGGGLNRTVNLNRVITETHQLSVSLSNINFNSNPGGGVDVLWLSVIIVGSALFFVALVVVWRRRRW